jgi:hypothetical protein
MRVTRPLNIRAVKIVGEVVSLLALDMQTLGRQALTEGCWIAVQRGRWH